MTSAPDPGSSTTSSPLRDQVVWIAPIAVVAALFWLLAPILTPFLIAAVFAYIGDPLVDRMERRGLSRTVGVGVLFVFASLLIGASLVLIAPLLQTQVLVLVDNIPAWAQWIEQVAMPKLGLAMPHGYQLDGDGLRKFLASHWDGAGDVASLIASYLGRSTPALLGLLANLFLVPIVSFYLLRDWDRMVSRIRDLIPRRLLPRGIAFAQETDDVLGALIRGQLLVMLALAFIYSLGLWLIGLKVGLLIGLISGLVSFVPYLGFAGGLVAASIAMLVQEQALTPVIWVVLVFWVGQLLEGGVLTPMLVGDRIGLHPVAVIFAIMAGGQLFGIVGIIMALPVAAVLAVICRHALHHWTASHLYQDVAAPPPAATAADVSIDTDRSPLP